jgi:hypothetical protein
MPCATDLPFCIFAENKTKTQNPKPKPRTKNQKKNKATMASLPEGLAAKAAALGIEVSWIAKPVTHTSEQAQSVHARNEAAYGRDGMR